MTLTRPPAKLTVLLTANAALLTAVLLAVVTRGPGGPAAYAQPVPGAARGGLAVMPAQMTVNTYGCFVLDADNQTLAAYQFLPGEKDLRLVAARDIQYDRRLTQFNTAPAPADVRQLVESQAQPPRSAPTTAPSPERPADR